LSTNPQINVTNLKYTYIWMCFRIVAVHTSYWWGLCTCTHYFNAVEVPLYSISEKPHRNYLCMRSYHCTPCPITPGFILTSKIFSGEWN